MIDAHCFRPLARFTLALGIAVGATGCAHTHAPPPSPATVPATKPEHEQGVETGIPVSSTPQGLMHDGAEKKIQERLREKGLLRADQCSGRLDGDTRDALRRFQKSQGLPTTGLPSYETVEHLQLKLDAIFRSTLHPADPPPARPRSSG